MERNQFTFYFSFYKTIRRIKNKAARADAYDAICRYALTGELPDLDKLPYTAAMVLDMAIPVIDSGSKKAESGKRGGSKQEANRKQTQIKAEANRKQTASEKEGEIEGEIEGEVEVEIEKEKENKCFISPTPTPPPAGTEIGAEAKRAAFAAVMNAYMDTVNPHPSGVCIDALKTYTERLSAPVVLHVLQICVDDKKTAWSYISAVLARYQRDGLDSMEKVEMDERDRAAEREKRETERNLPAWKRGRNAPAKCEKTDVSADVAALDAALESGAI